MKMLIPTFIVLAILLCAPTACSGETGYAIALMWHTNYATAGEVRYRTLGDAAWADSLERGPDSLAHFVVIADLAGGTSFEWQARDSFPGCPWTEWALPDTFETPSDCPSIAQSAWTGYATSPTTEKIAWQTDYPTMGIIQIGPLAGAYGPPTAESGPDSTTHYFLKSSLTEGTWYKYRTNGLYTEDAACDSAGWSEEKTFLSLCGTQAAAAWSSNPLPLCIDEANGNEANGYQGGLTQQKMHVEYKLHSGSVWTEVVQSSFTSAALHTVIIPALAPTTSYDFRFRWENPCGTFSSYSTTLTRTTDESGLLPDECGGM